jgi:hypothetical protein
LGISADCIIFDLHDDSGGGSMISEQREYCIFCGRPKDTDHHLIFGMSLRRLADEDGLTIPICNNHHITGDVVSRIHDNVIAEKLSKIAGQLAWEKHEIAKKGLTEIEARKAFIDRYGKNFL